MTEIRIHQKKEMSKEHKEGFEQNPNVLGYTLPDFDKPVLNMHLMSDEGEIATIQLRKGMTAEQLVDDYTKAFPKETKKFLSYIRMRNQGLLNDTGMSEHKTIMALGSIPETIKIGMAYLYGPDYWRKKSNLYGFFRKFPKLMIGNHKPKGTTGRGHIIK